MTSYIIRLQILQTPDKGLTNLLFKYATRNQYIYKICNFSNYTCYKLYIACIKCVIKQMRAILCCYFFTLADLHTEFLTSNTKALAIPCFLRYPLLPILRFSSDSILVQLVHRVITLLARSAQRPNARINNRKNDTVIFFLINTKITQPLLTCL